MNIPHMKLNENSIIICLRQSEISVERISACYVIEENSECGIHCLSCSGTNDQSTGSSGTVGCASDSRARGPYKLPVLEINFFCR